MNIAQKVADGFRISEGKGFCIAAHFGQKRKFTGEDYANHPIRVANILAQHGYGDVHSQLVGLLHDVDEDTDITKQYIATYFGQDVAEDVDWLTKRDWNLERSRPDARRWSRSEKKQFEADRLKGAPARVKTYKLADRLDNMTILKEEPSFASIFAAETRHLLDHALKEGDPVLWAKVDAIVREFQQQKALQDA